MIENKITSSESYIAGFDIEITAKLLKQKFQRFLKDNRAGITVDQWVMIKILHDENDLVQQMLAKRSHKDAPTTTRIVDLLEVKGLVERKISAVDRRKFIIHLTKNGAEKYAQIISYYKNFRDLAYNGISDSDYIYLQKILNRIQYNLT